MKSFDEVMAELPEDMRKRVDEAYERMQREDAARRIWDMQADKCREFANIASRFTR